METNDDNKVAPSVDVPRLVLALREALRWCPMCRGAGEVDARPYVSAGEAQELERAGIPPEPKTIRPCKTCAMPRDVLKEYDESISQNTPDHSPQ